MRRMRIFGIAVAVAMAGCGNQSDPSLEAELEADIGPAGGTLTGVGGSGLDGVRLVIPAGALTATVHVRVARGVDGTPLPLLADGVGPTFSIEPATPLAVPAQLTLPYDPRAVAEHVMTAADLKVWMRQGEGWTRLEQTAADERTVTVALPALGTAAAGLLIVPKTPVCATSCFKLLVPACQGQFCLSLAGQIKTPVPEASDSDGHFYWYWRSPGVNQRQLVRRDLSSGVEVTSIVQTVLPSERPSFGHLTGDGDGVWSLGGDGLLRWRFDGGTPGRFDTDGRPGQPLRTDAGTIVRFTGIGGRIYTSVGHQGVFQPRQLWDQQGYTPIEAAAVPGAESFMLLADATTPQALASIVIQQTVGSGRGSPTSFTGGPLYHPAGSAALDLAFVSPLKNAIELFPGAGSIQEIAVPAGDVARLVYDVHGGLWIARRATAELEYYGSDGGLYDLPLAGEGAADYNDHIPVNLHRAADGSILVTTRSGQLLRVSRTP